MKVFLFSVHGDGVMMAQQLALEGHQVMLYMHDKDVNASFEGLVWKTDDWEKAAAESDFTIFDANEHGDKAEMLRAKGLKVWGGSRLADKLENDRAFGNEIMERAGIPIPETKHFKNAAEAKKLVEEWDAERLVIKLDDPKASKASSYVAKSKDDMLQRIEAWTTTEDSAANLGKGGIIQEFIKGVEVSIEGWFDGENFLYPYNITMEDKKLLNDDKGPNTGCYSADTEVLTRRGWVLFKDLTNEDYVLTLKDDGTAEFHKPTERQEYDWTGPMVRFSCNRSYDLLVTPGHHHVMRPRTESGYGLKHQKAEEFARHPRSGYMAQSFIWKGETYFEQRFLLPAISNEWPAPKGGIRKWLAPDRYIDMGDWCEFLGLYLSEGCVTYQKARGKRTPTGAEIAQEKYRDYAESVVARLPFKYCATPKGFVLTSKQLGVYLEQFGKCRDKFIPREILSLPPMYLERLLRGLMMGDGSMRPGNWTYWTISKRLADDFQELCFKVGRAATIRRRPNKDIYEIGVHGWLRGRKVEPSNISREPYSGKVYDVTVENHTLFVRRNGKACWSGNCAQNLVKQLRPAHPKLARLMLEPLIPVLRRGKFIGQIDVNCIVDKDGEPHALEFTPRAGYDATPTLVVGLPGYGEAVARALHIKTCEGEACECPQEPPCYCLCCGAERPPFWFLGAVRTYLPPYPFECADHKVNGMAYDESAGAQIHGWLEGDEKTKSRVILYDAKLEDGKLLTAGTCGIPYIVLGHGPTVKDMVDDLWKHAGEVSVADLCFRTDLGPKQEKALAKVEHLLR